MYGACCLGNTFPYEMIGLQYFKLFLPTLFHMQYNMENVGDITDVVQVVQQNK